MFFRCCRNNKVKQETDIKTIHVNNSRPGPIDAYPLDPNEMFYLTIKMKDGSVKKENITKHCALLKYGEILNDPEDENYEDNYIHVTTKRDYNRFHGICIPMHENPIENNFRCVIL